MVLNMRVYCGYRLAASIHAEWEQNRGSAKAAYPVSVPKA